MVTVAFIWCFWCFNWFSYCRGKCICAGQGNTIVSHFVVQRGDFTVAIACVPCGPRRSLSLCVSVMILWVCWKLSAAEQVKTDCCNTPAVVSTLLTPLPVSCPLTTPHHYNLIGCGIYWVWIVILVDMLKRRWSINYTLINLGKVAWYVQAKGRIRIDCICVAFCVCWLYANGYIYPPYTID